MTKTNHLLGGAVLSYGFVQYATTAWDIESSWAIASIIAIILGSIAPDWMEMPTFSLSKRSFKRIIPHRTLTHWVLGWVGLVYYGYTGFEESVGFWSNGDSSYLLILAFSLGALLHTLQDLMTPHGVPIFIPFYERSKIPIVRGEFFEKMFVFLFALGIYNVT